MTSNYEAQAIQELLAFKSEMEVEVLARQDDVLLRLHRQELRIARLEQIVAGMAKQK